MDRREPLANLNGRMSGYGGAQRAGARKSMAPTTPSRRTTMASSSRMSMAPHENFGMQAARRQSTIGGNGSATPRKSSVGLMMGGRGGHAMKKADQRPIQDKRFQKKEIDTVMGFLSKTMFQGNCNVKMMRAPAASEFIAMLEHLFMPIDDMFRVENTEQDIPFIFKLLKYPTLTALSRNNLKAIGSPHAWPHLLAALCWLTELMIHDEIMTQDVNHGVLADPQYEMNLQFFDHVARDYRRFLVGEADDFPQAEEELEQIFQERDHEIRADVQALRDQRDAARKELEALQAEAAQLPELRKKKAAFQRDSEKFAKLIAELEQHKARLEQLVQQKVEERNTSFAAFDEQTHEHDELVAIIRDQEMKAIDVERINNERETAQRDLEAASEEKDALERHLAELEMQTTDKIESVQESIKEYNAAVRMMNMAPPTAKHARGVTFEVKFNPVQPEIAGLHVKEIVKPELEKSKEFFARVVADKQMELVSVNEELEKIEETCADKAEEVAALEKKVRISEQQIKREKETLREAAQHKVTEVENVQLDTARARKAAADALLQSQKELEALKLKHTQVLAALEHEEELMWAEVLQVMEDLTQHKEDVRAILIKTQQHFIRTKAEFSRE